MSWRLRVPLHPGYFPGSFSLSVSAREKKVVHSENEIETYVTDMILTQNLNTYDVSKVRTFASAYEHLCLNNDDHFSIITTMPRNLLLPKPC